MLEPISNQKKNEQTSWRDKKKTTTTTDKKEIKEFLIHGKREKSFQETIRWSLTIIWLNQPKQKKRRSDWIADAKNEKEGEYANTLNRLNSLLVFYSIRFDLNNIDTNFDWYAHEVVVIICLRMRLNQENQCDCRYRFEEMRKTWIDNVCFPLDFRHLMYDWMNSRVVSKQKNEPCHRFRLLGLKNDESIR